MLSTGLVFIFQQWIFSGGKSWINDIEKISSDSISIAIIRFFIVNWILKLFRHGWHFHCSYKPASPCCWSGTRWHPGLILTYLTLFCTSSLAGSHRLPWLSGAKKREKVYLYVCIYRFSLPSRHIFWQQLAIAVST